MIIVSVSQNKDRIEDNCNTLEIKRRLEQANVNFKLIEGVYKGQTEFSFIIEDKDIGRALADAYNQECYLEQGHYGYWYLIDTPTGAVMDSFKTIKQVSREAAEATENYSIMDGKYYIASKF